jgi:hypothetical protein
VRVGATFAPDDVAPGESTEVAALERDGAGRNRRPSERFWNAVSAHDLS